MKRILATMTFLAVAVVYLTFNAGFVSSPSLAAEQPVEPCKTAGVETVQYVAETSLIEHVSENDEVVIQVVVNQIKDADTNLTAEVPGGMNGYSAQITLPEDGIAVTVVTGLAPFDAVSYDPSTGIFSVENTPVAVQPDNMVIAEIHYTLNGSCLTSYNLTVDFLSVTAAGDPQLYIPGEQPNTMTFRRGDVYNDGYGHVDLDDSYVTLMIITEHLLPDNCSIRNIPSVFHDGEYDRITVVDALFTGFRYLKKIDEFFQEYDQFDIPDTSTTVELNHGQTIYLLPGNDPFMEGIPVSVHNVPDLGSPTDGFAGYTFQLNWDSDNIQVDSTDSISDFLHLESTPDDQNGRLIATGFDLSGYTTGNITLYNLGISVAENVTGPVVIGITVEDLTDKNGNQIPVTSVNMTIETLKSIEVLPENPTINPGDTRQFTAIGVYTDNTTENITDKVTWTSSNESVATVDPNGLATPLNAGQTTINATIGTFSCSTVLTVLPPALTSIQVYPENAEIQEGSTQQYSAIGLYNDDTTLNITGSVTWSTGNCSIAAIDGNGLASGTGEGTTFIKAADPATGIWGSANITVTPLPVVSVTVNAPDKVVPGTFFIARLDIGYVEDLNAVQYDVLFDDSVLQLEDITSGLIGGTEIPVLKAELAPGHWRVVQTMMLDTVSGDGYLADIRFEAIGSIGDSSNISILNGLLCGMNGEIPSMWIGDEVELSVIPGDADNNGIVNVLDMTKVARIILGFELPTPGADANLDGNINVLDMTTIAKIILGLD
ncbi:MAG: Ig-like domain-containing protein [Dehalococcoidales bacterium]|nr:Ig-like domain-containing protein [Dehalococcoidales bacterium]